MKPETILQGIGAYLTSAQGELIGRHENCDIYKLRTSAIRLGLYDAKAQQLVVIDGAALAALAREVLIEASPAPERMAQRVAVG